MLLADEFAASHEEHLSARVSVVCHQRYHVLVFERRGYHLLPGNELLYCLHLVAQLRRLLELQVFGRLFHLLEHLFG